MTINEYAVTCHGEIVYLSGKKRINDDVQDIKIPAVKFFGRTSDRYAVAYPNLLTDHVSTWYPFSHGESIDPSWEYIVVAERDISDDGEWEESVKTPTSIDTDALASEVCERVKREGATVSILEEDGGYSLYLETEDDWEDLQCRLAHADSDRLKRALTESSVSLLCCGEDIYIEFPTVIKA